MIIRLKGQSETRLGYLQLGLLCDLSWLGGVETASKQHIFITFFFSEVKTSPKYYVTVMFWFSQLKTTPKYDVNATL